MQIHLSAEAVFRIEENAGERRLHLFHGKSDVITEAPAGLHGALHTSYTLSTIRKKFWRTRVVTDYIRCDWCLIDPLYRRYHDEEWGVPCRDDHTLFEFLVLESAQAGLSWLTILRKREHYRRAFAGFDAEAVATFDQQKVKQLLQDSGIVRNRAKIEAAINNARCFLDIRQQFGSFAHYFWQFTDNRTLVNHWRSLNEVPASTVLSHTISKDMKQRGFRFFGPIICYAHMQATGLVNDHLVSCHRHRACAQAALLAEA